MTAVSVSMQCIVVGTSSGGIVFLDNEGNLIMKKRHLLNSVSAIAIHGSVVAAGSKDGFILVYDWIIDEDYSFRGTLDSGFFSFIFCL